MRGGLADEDAATSPDVSYGPAQDVLHPLLARVAVGFPLTIELREMTDDELLARMAMNPIKVAFFNNKGRVGKTSLVYHRRNEWSERKSRNPDPSLALPSGKMMPIGYVVLQHGLRLDRPIVAYDHWIGGIPSLYQRAVLGLDAADKHSVGDDPNCLAVLKHYHSLMPMAQEARKPVFHLRPADGALGAHQQAVQRIRQEFEGLARAIQSRVTQS